MKEKQVLKMKNQYPFLKIVQLDKGLMKTKKEYHYIQEDYPNEISQSIIEWSLTKNL